MEALGRMVKATIGGDFLSRFSVGNCINGSIIISHLFFAYDTLLFCEADCDQIQTLRALLFSFEAVSGLKVNLGKSGMVSVGAVPGINSLANFLCCRVASLPMKYLHLSLEAMFMARAIWDGVVEKVEKMLVGWKWMYSSKGGRLTLIKSTLSNLPTLFFFFFFSFIYLFILIFNF
ncbi:hypothetical protein I3842_01G099500 [Carya illinoinensis]|uniref:Reverse transcriptase domain-containing protein n=1 Tax=Carya illinoinensis TaxID=32201 RepID=A0A922K4L3_CARIL|nr:hypothetical protein I3842_01G099500 [Carya illinoinensis]